MKMEIVLDRGEVEDVLRETVEEAAILLSKNDDGTLTVEVEPTVLKPDEFVAAVSSKYDIPELELELEMLTMLSDGGVGIALKSRGKV